MNGLHEADFLFHPFKRVLERKDAERTSFFIKCVDNSRVAFDVNRRAPNIISFPLLPHGSILDHSILLTTMIRPPAT